MRIAFARLGANRLEDTFLGRGSAVRKNHGRHQAYRLMIGDDSEVLL